MGSKNKASGESDDSEADLLPSVSLPGLQPSDSITRSSLKEAISARLGKKTWHNTFFLNDANLTIHLLDPLENTTTLQLDLRMSGKLKTFGPGKFDLSLDVMRFEVVDCRHQEASSTPSHFFADGKILSVGEPRGSLRFRSKIRSDSSAASLMPRSPAIVIPDSSEANQGRLSNRTDSDQQDLPLPSYADLPHGVVCRLASSKNIGALKLRVSAHPVTLVWHKSSINAVTEFFASSSSQLQTVLTRQLQNVATPLARKAQLALLSPDAITVDVNMAAPKVWLPVSAESNDAVFLDAGRFRVACAKEERGTDTHWEVIARDIQVMFVRLRRSVSRNGKTSIRGDFSVTGLPDSEEQPIIRPFHIHLNDSLLESVPRSSHSAGVDTMGTSLIGNGPIRKTTVNVSPIRLNLVDAEVLARAIGKWYAQGIGRVKGRAGIESNETSKSVQSPTLSIQVKESTSKDSGTGSTTVVPIISSSHSLLIQIEKIEMAIEGHSKSSVQMSDDQSVASLASLDTFMDPTPKKRTYIVEIFDILVDRTKNANKTRTMLTILDASIARVKENASPFTSFVPQESQYLILVRTDGRRRTGDLSRQDEVGDSAFQPILESPARVGDKYARGVASSLGASAASPLGRLQLSAGTYSASPEEGVEEKGGTCLLSASLFHDSALHLDEVEIDIDSITVRVTPTSLKDSAKGLHRFLELVELTTKEMERKVHEEGRNARQIGRLGKLLIFEQLILFHR